MRKQETQKREGKQNNVMPVLLLMVLALALLVVIVLAVKKISASKMEDQTVNAAADSGQGGQDGADMPEKWQEGVVSYNGERYLYNTDMDIYLYMGIDHEGPVEKSEDHQEGGQSDAMFLLAVDKAAEKISVVAINRNTMTDIDKYSRGGSYITTTKSQICLQHGYGDGMRLSCSRSVDAVSRLFYNLPIDGYLSLNMGALPILNDAVGGVTVEVLEDLESAAKNVSLKKGETVTLSGDEAYVYLRSRDTAEFDSATARLERQMQYLNALLPQAKAATGGSLSRVMELYEEIEPYMVSNIDFASLAEQVMEYGFDSRDMYHVPGETVMGETYEEYHADEEGLYELILQVFYTKEA